KDVQSLEGILSLRFPTAVDTMHLEDVSVGRSAQFGDTKVTVTAHSRHSLTFETNKPAERVVYIRLLAPEGKAISFSGPEVTALPDGGARLDLSPFNAPARAEIVIA